MEMIFQHALLQRDKAAGSWHISLIFVKGTVTDLAKKVHRARQILVVRSAVPPGGSRHLQHFRPNTVAMATTVWHLWQWQTGWPQWNIWDDTGRARVHRHTIKTSGREGTVTESRLHLEEVKNFMGKHDRGWKGERRWQGVHLQLAYCGMLIRPAKTRHLPLKCHILMRRARAAAGFVDFCQAKGAALCLPFHRQSLLCSLYPERFLLTFSCSFSRPFCYAVYSVMNGSISSFFSLSLSLLLAGIDYNLCNCAETRLI